MVTISVAIPCYKSAKTIEKVVDNIRKVILSRENYDYQIILVNDYPFDGTFDVIKKICEKDSKVIGINLSKNFGQTSAKMAAINYFSGDVLVYMDDDGQHPVEEIFKLTDKVLEGYDAVYAYFYNKKHSVFKKITSSINSKMLEVIGTKPKGVHYSSFYALSKFAAKSYLKYKSPFPSMGGYLNSISGSVTEVKMQHKERMEGKSNYSLKKLLKLWLTGFTNFSIIPLRIVATLGIIFSVIGIISGVAIVIQKLIIPSIAAGYTSNMAVQFFMGGLILFSLGFIGEYIGRIYMTLSNLQQYMIRDVINGERIDDSEI